MEFDNILPDRIAEFDPLGRVTVRSDLVIAYKFSGEPVSKTLSVGSFSEVKSALEYISTQPSCMHEVSIPIPGASLTGFVTDDESTKTKYLTLASDKREGVSPDRIHDLYVAVTDSLTYLDIVMVLEPEQMEMFDRGFVVLELSRTEPPALIFNINPGERTVETMADGITQMLKRVNLITNKLLMGISDNP